MNQTELRKFVFLAGRFEARLRHNTSGSTSLSMCYRIVGHPSNLPGLQRVCAHLGCGRTWASGSLAGWSCDTIPEMQKLAARLEATGAKHRALYARRAPVIEAWALCLRLLPKVLRAQAHANYLPYKASAYTADRQEAVEALHAANRKHPPYPSRLPAGFCDRFDWAEPDVDPHEI